MHRSIVGVLVIVLSLVIVSLLAADAGAVCGNGILEAGECCDDGNTVNNDACNTDCTCPKACCNDPTQLCVTDADCANTGAGGPCGCDEHLKCYKVKDPLALTGIVDLNSPQFGLEAGCKIKKATKFCVPATKTVKSAQVGKTPLVPLPIGGQELSDDYICYSISCPKPVPPNTAVVDQFGTRTLSKFKAFELCGPAKKCPAAISPDDLNTGELLPVGAPDPVWELVGVPAAPNGPLLGPAVVVPPFTQTSGVNWAPALPLSSWISPRLVTTGQNCEANGCPAGDYTYQTCWCQCGDVSLDLTLLADNCATVKINGVALPGGSTAACTSAAGLAGTPFMTSTHIPPATVPQPSGGAKTCLQVEVTNRDVNSPTGMDLVVLASGSFTSGCH